jgi:hypothetical protein
MDVLWSHHLSVATADAKQRAAIWVAKVDSIFCRDGGEAVSGDIWIRELSSASFAAISQGASNIAAWFAYAMRMPILKKRRAIVDEGENPFSHHFQPAETTTS